MEPSERVLRPLERTQFGRWALPGRLGRHFDGITKFLQRDTDRVQPLRQINGPRVDHRGAQSRGPRRGSRVDSPSPRFAVGCVLR